VGIRNSVRELACLATLEPPEALCCRRSANLQAHNNTPKDDCNRCYRPAPRLRLGIIHQPADFPYETPVVRGSPELYERNMLDELALKARARGATGR
jgi:hypothetical protein